jgi:hypothetical protein
MGLLCISVWILAAPILTNNKELKSNTIEDSKELDIAQHKH